MPIMASHLAAGPVRSSHTPNDPSPNLSIPGGPDDTREDTIRGWEMAFVGAVVFSMVYPFLDELLGSTARRAARRFRQDSRRLS